MISFKHSLTTFKLKQNKWKRLSKQNTETLVIDFNQKIEGDTWLNKKRKTVSNDPFLS